MEKVDDSILNYSFDDLNINDNLLRGIYSYGFETPSNIQYKSIPIINTKRDLIAQAQSGTGKTGSFLIGLLNNIDYSLKESQGIVICPTHELAIQCYEVCNELMKYTSATSALLIGKTNVQKSIEELRKNPSILIGTPGRILDMIMRKELFTNNIKMMVFDEADEILSMGFIDTISTIISYIPKESQICIFSATIPEEIKEITTKFMNNPEQLLVNKEDLTLEGINQFHIILDNYNWKFDVLNDLYETLNITQSIIYVNSKKSLRYLKDKLDTNNFPTSYICGDMSPQDRKLNMDLFKSGATRVMLSTDLLSRGIDIQQLSLVINFDLPSNKETYIHRIGRSGRYGRKGVAINLVLKDEINEKEELESFYNIKIPPMPENIKDYLSV
jgi:translation initiation factor 4A